MALSAMLLFPFASVNAESAYTDSMEAEFMQGGQITLKLSAGEHEIVESADNHIRVHWTLEDESDDVDTQAKVKGNQATIDIDGPRKHFRTVIEVPRNSDLTVRLTAGELDVGNVGGDRDIQLRAGDLSIEVGDTDNYGNVEGSLWAGDINAGPFNRSASGLFRSIEWQGEGDHDVYFKLYAGDVRLYQGGD